MCENVLLSTHVI